MALKIASWNVEGRLSPLAINHRGTPEQIVQAIERLEADVVFLPEAFSTGHVAADIREALAALGYEFHAVPYEEGGPLRHVTAVDRPSMLLLSRFPVRHVRVVRLGNLRNAISAVVQDPEGDQLLRVVGVHLDDRSEELRLRQVPDLVRLIQDELIPTIMLGDFNAMHGGDWQARLLRTRLTRKLAHWLHSSVITRASEMATGETLGYLLQATGYHEADPLHQPTTTPKMRGHEWLPSIRLIHIDHMVVSPEVQVKKYSVSADGGSDHRAISALITLDKLH